MIQARKRHRERQCVQVDDIDVGEGALAEYATVGVPDEARGIGCDLAYPVLEGKHTLVPHPVGQQVRGLTGVHDLGRVRAGISKSHDGHR